MPIHFSTGFLLSASLFFFFGLSAFSSSFLSSFLSESSSFSSSFSLSSSLSLGSSSDSSSSSSGSSFFSSSFFPSSSSSASSSTSTTSAFSSSSAISSSGSGTFGADLRSLVTGILVAAASLIIDGSVVTKTTVLSAFAAVLEINLIFTILLNTPAFFGGTRATILDLEPSILPIISVMSSSGSI